MEKNIEETKSNEFTAKLIATQDMMKDKFKKAYANRLEREQNIHQSMRPLATSTKINNSENPEPEQSDSLRSLSKTKNTNDQLRFTNKSYSTHADVKKLDDYFDDSDPNQLCIRLRLLITAGHMNNMKKINRIISKLHELDVLV